MEALTIQTLAKEHLEEAVRLLGFLNPETSTSVLTERLRSLWDDHPHYQLLGAFAGADLVGICGAWIATKMWCGRYLEIDNLVVDPERRSSGAGTRLIEHLVELGRSMDCRIIVLDSYTGNHASHRLYHRLGFEIWGFHFIKPIGDWSGRDSA
jgi:ribosomal protein S18 acetylase RimI-like enzyme